jgi:hypothetical protein
MSKVGMGIVNSLHFLGVLVLPDQEETQTICGVRATRSVNS